MPHTNMHPQDGLDSPVWLRAANGKSLTINFFGNVAEKLHRRPHRPMHPQDAIDSPFGYA